MGSRLRRVSSLPRVLPSWAILTAALVQACDPKPSNSVSIVLTTASGTNPASGLGPGKLTLFVTQKDQTREQTANLEGATFDVVTASTSQVDITTIAARFTFDDGAIRFGATPAFVPLYAGFATVVIGAPRTCETLVDPRIDGRVEGALVAYGVNPILFGGRATLAADAVGHTEVDTLTTLQLGDSAAFVDNSATLAGLSRDMRETRAVPLAPETESSTPFLVVGRANTAQVAFVYDATTGAETTLVAHPGAGFDSSVADLGDNGAVVVGGLLEAAAVDGVTWVSEDGAVTGITRLATPRMRPALVALASGVVVAGGQAAGQPQIEFLALGQNGVFVTGASTDELLEPVGVRSVNHASAAVLGGQTGAELSARVQIVSCTGASCSLRDATESWATARRAPAIVETRESTWLLGGLDGSGGPSTSVDRVTFDGTHVRVDTSISLPRPRQGAAAVEVARGVVLLAGGADGSDVLRDLVVCWPPDLEAL
jgi:hypothetical protein